MKVIKTIYALLATGTVLALLNGCIPSVHPFYTAKDLHFDPQLPGEWQSKEDGKETWKFERAEDQGYKLTITEKDKKTGSCDARLFKLKDELFLDIIPNDCKFAEDQSGVVSAALFPGHLLVRLSLSGSELKLAFFDFDWLEKHLKEHPAALAHHREEKRIVLTAATEDLQRFVLQHLAEGELFQQPTPYARH